MTDAHTTQVDRHERHVSVLIPCFERADVLRKNLMSLAAQTYTNLEIIILDDCSTSDVVRHVVEEFPRVIYKRTPRNLGLIAARNYGLNLCTGEYVLNLDDDSWPEDVECIERAVRYLDEDESIAVLALNLRNRDKPLQYATCSGLVPANAFGGGANMFRKRAVQSAGAYTAEFFRQGEECELALRLLDRGWSIMLARELIIYHDVSPVNREPGKHLAYEAVNMLRREMLRCPTALLPFGIARALFWAVRRRASIDGTTYRNELLSRHRPLADFVFKRRKPVRLSTYLRWNMLDLRGRRLPRVIAA